jgi:hypothetical protein
MFCMSQSWSTTFSPSEKDLRAGGTCSLRTRSSLGSAPCTAGPKLPRGARRVRRADPKRLGSALRVIRGIWFGPCSDTADAPRTQHLTQAWCHCRLGHVGFRRLADLKHEGLLGEYDPSPAALMQASKQKAMCSWKALPCVASTTSAMPCETPAPAAPRALPTLGLP